MRLARLDDFIDEDFDELRLHERERGGQSGKYKCADDHRAMGAKILKDS